MNGSMKRPRFVVDWKKSNSIVEGINFKHSDKFMHDVLYCS